MIVNLNSIEENISLYYLHIISYYLLVTYKYQMDFKLFSFLCT